MAFGKIYYGSEPVRRPFKSKDSRLATCRRVDRIFGKAILPFQYQTCLCHPRSTLALVPNLCQASSERYTE